MKIQHCARNAGIDTRRVEFTHSTVTRDVDKTLAQHAGQSVLLYRSLRIVRSPPNPKRLTGTSTSLHTCSCVELLASARIHASTQMPSGSRSFDTHSVMPNLLCRIFLMHIWMHCMRRSARSPSRQNEYGLKIECRHARHLPAAPRKCLG